MVPGLFSLPLADVTVTSTVTDVLTSTQVHTVTHTLTHTVMVQATPKTRTRCVFCDNFCLYPAKQEACS